MADDTMTTFHDYPLKAREADVPALLAMATALGLLRLDDETGELVPDGGATWDILGPVYRPTGNMIEVEGVLEPEMAPVVDEQGKAYWHANVRLRDVSLRDLAEAAAPEHPGIAQALQELERYFVTDGQGNVRQPNQPARRWG